jgi:hypothetical protein
VNVAVTDLAVSIVTVQVDAEPVQAPLQPVNAALLPATAVKVMVSPAGTLAMQEPPAPVPVKTGLQ